MSSTWSPVPDMAGPTVQAVLFDWGGTLTPWHTVDLTAQWRAYAEVYDPGRAGELAQKLHRQEVEAWRHAEQHQRSGTLEQLLRAAGIDPGQERHHAAMRAYLEAWTPHTFIDPDAPPLLAALRDREIRVGVLSNTLWPREHHEAVFARDGLLELLDGAVYSSEIPYTKPHPEAFRAAMRAVGVSDARNVVFVGDRPIDDVGGAKALGMRAVLLPHSAVPANDVQPDATVQRLRDVLPLIDAWNSRAGKGDG